jgi:hypothetical protein
MHLGKQNRKRNGDSCFYCAQSDVIFPFLQSDSPYQQFKRRPVFGSATYDIYLLKAIFALSSTNPKRKIGVHPSFFAAFSPVFRIYCPKSCTFRSIFLNASKGVDKDYSIWHNALNRWRMRLHSRRLFSPRVYRGGAEA